MGAGRTERAEYLSEKDRGLSDHAKGVEGRGSDRGLALLLSLRVLLASEEFARPEVTAKVRALRRPIIEHFFKSIFE